jgi:hypothetical protein
MPRYKRRSWSPEELIFLNKLVVAGASPRTAAGALNRSKEAIRIRARMIGCPFPYRDEDKRQKLRSLETGGNGFWLVNKRNSIGPRKLVKLPRDFKT